MKWIIGFLAVLGISVWAFVSFLKSNLKEKKEVEVISDNQTDQSDDNMEVVREKMMNGIEEDK
ncbi:hypothetical protein [Acetohalobium arabaticum]|uniref:Uncharacterized protein n=1 Tax=Acetohalobium arabaticum (strain ATCC 49924 / DSM 5501 / Z-7288) TaxID=574087 RepID=D9QVV2_ACEAZ|nr:hypothetical protein [Acetohalobium arabaticum]ADL12361.1 hypothetical protein Acear_0826 [Acetohalobium arabaticum DSM 5501]